MYKIKTKILHILSKISTMVQTLINQLCLSALICYLKVQKPSAQPDEHPQNVLTANKTQPRPWLLIQKPWTIAPWYFDNYDYNKKITTKKGESPLNKDKLTSNQDKFPSKKNEKRYSIKNLPFSKLGNNDASIETLPPLIKPILTKMGKNEVNHSAVSALPSVKLTIIIKL